MSDRVDDLITALSAADAVRRSQGAEQLSRLGEGARAAAVPLVHAAGDPDEAVREWAVAALEELGPPLEKDVESLATMLDSAAPDVAYWAATLLGRLGPTAVAATPCLIKALTNTPHTVAKERAAWALGKIGPGAGEAASALDKAAAGNEPRLARVAQRSLKQIRG
jgi:HEAT repeat protein